jgi:predicted SnoaL-like aldol condensation-catalyzing enzyme
MSSQNSTQLKRLLLEGFGRGDISVLDEVVAPDFIEHQPGLAQGREGLKQVIRTLRQSFPDLSYTVVQMVEDGDKCGDISAAAVPTWTHLWVKLPQERRWRST